MPTITIQPSAKDVLNILTSPDFFRIPRFQRPFSWEAGHVSDFWHDAIVNMDSGYFIGPMVVYKAGAREVAIVDGQQRLTVITLILSVLRDRFTLYGDEDSSEAIHRLIERPDQDNRKRLVLQSDVEEGSWIHAAQVLRAKGEDAPKSNFDAAPWAALTEIVSGVDKLLNEAMEKYKTPKRKQAAALEVLKNLRTQVESLQVIWVPLDSEDDGYEIFETLNSKGKDLELADRMKNFFLGHLKAQNVNVDTHKRRWMVISESFESMPGSVDLNKFILHWWLSRAPYVAERKVFGAVKRAVKRPRAAKTFDAFEADTRRYRMMVDPDSVSWPIERHPIRDALSGLQVLRIAQPMPFILALYRSYEEGSVKIKKVISTLQIIENYHFQVNTISARSSSGGVSEMYASHARQLFEAADAAERRKAIDDLLDKLRGRKPTREDFVESFGNRLVFANEYQRDRRLVQYVLQRLHTFSKPSSAVDFSQFSMEHLKPQSSIAASDDLPVVGGIGNLFYIHHSINEQMGNKSLSERRRFLCHTPATTTSLMS